MSRTLKDVPYKVRKENKKYNQYNPNADCVQVPYTREWVGWDGELVDHSWHYLVRLPTTIPKKRKELDTEEHWMTTPGWWIRLMMNKPKRREAHMLEKKAHRVEDLEDVDFVNSKRKPHIYYW